MKRIQLAILAVGLAGAMSASASVTISGSDFNDPALVGSYNGTYVAAPSGHMNLAYTGPDDNAVVGAIGPFGTLSSQNMSFDYSNLIGDNGNGPYANFGVSVDGLWGGSAQRFMIIALSGNQLNGATPIHVWDVTAGANYAPVVWGSTLSSILGDTVGGVAFGDMQVLRAYADFGAATGSGVVVGSVDINSITVGPVPVPEPTTMIAGALLLLPFGATTLRMLRKNRAA
jgi:hypothetical protein